VTVVEGLHGPSIEVEGHIFESDDLPMVGTEVDVDGFFRSYEDDCFYVDLSWSADTPIGRGLLRIKTSD
jgi:hypothetical protein